MVKHAGVAILMTAAFVAGTFVPVVWTQQGQITGMGIRCRQLHEGACWQGWRTWHLSATFTRPVTSSARGMEN